MTSTISGQWRGVAATSLLSWQSGDSGGDFAESCGPLPCGRPSCWHYRHYLGDSCSTCVTRGFSVRGNLMALAGRVRQGTETPGLCARCHFGRRRTLSSFKPWDLRPKGNWGWVCRSRGRHWAGDLTAGVSAAGCTLSLTGHRGLPRQGSEDWYPAWSSAKWSWRFARNVSITGLWSLS